MSIISFCTAFLLSGFIINSCLHHHVAAGKPVTGPSREAVEIIRGGVGGAGSAPAPSPQMSPPPSPQPPTPQKPLPRLPPKPLATKGQPSPLDRIALVVPVIQKFKKLITSDPKGITKTWIGKDVCNKYKGFTCDIVPTFNVTALAAVNFNGYGFAGPNLSINGFIDQLPDIAIFHANSNNFSGPVPRISHLEHLFELDLSNNKYIGGFPNETLAGTNLTFLDLRFNTYSGTVPSKVFSLDLDVLFINNNNLFQKLPRNLGSTPVLYLTLANNKFIGSIPQSIGQAGNTLLEVLFLNNKLSGCLPYQIGLLKKATVFDVGSNILTGPIPHSFACLAKMELLNLARNQFYGTVPESVCKLPNMVNLTLSHNYFTQVGPACRNLIRKKVLDVRMNCILDLPFQRSATECAAFFSISRQCPNEPSFCKIPCQINGLNSEKLETSDDQATRSYNALAPNGL